jgi:hypothetical protein
VECEKSCAGDKEHVVNVVKHTDSILEGISILHEGGVKRYIHTFMKKEYPRLVLNGRII